MKKDPGFPRVNVLGTPSPKYDCHAEFQGDDWPFVSVLGEPVLQSQRPLNCGMQPPWTLSGSREEYIFMSPPNNPL